jgi:AcrR family transcriptional regulator
VSRVWANVWRKLPTWRGGARPAAAYARGVTGAGTETSAVPLPTLREAQKQLTRDRLVDAAFRLFNEHGYEATTADQIARSAGMSRATFYLHFKSKAELVVDLQHRLRAEVVDIYAALDEVVGGTRDDVRTWVEGVLRVWERDRLRLEAMEQALAVEQGIADQWLVTLDDAIDAMPRALAAADVDVAAARMRLLTLMMQLDRTMFFLVIRNQPLDRAALVEALTLQWSAALGM